MSLNFLSQISLQVQGFSRYKNKFKNGKNRG